MSDGDFYVVDDSVGVKWVLPEAGSDVVHSVWSAVARGTIDLIAPDIYVAEVTNVIWKRCRLRSEISEDEARAALSTSMGALPALIPTATLASQATELALAFRRSAYDCFYAALAIRRGITLITSDGALVRALGPATGRVIHLDDLATLD